MRIRSCTLYAHGTILAVVPDCRESGKPFSVYESLEVFSKGVSDSTLGKALLASLDKSREDVGSGHEGLDLDRFAKLFGERSIGGLDKRGGKAGFQTFNGQYLLYPWLRDGARGSDAGQRTVLALDTSPEEIARLARRMAEESLAHSQAGG